MLYYNEIKCIEKLCAELFLSSGLKASGIFVILLSQDGFESSSKQSFSKLSSEAAITRCSSTFLNTLQQENICVGVSFKVGKETRTQMCSCEYCEILYGSFFIEYIHWLLLSTDKVTVWCRPSCPIQKENVAWFLLKCFRSGQSTFCTYY